MKTAFSGLKIIAVALLFLVATHYSGREAHAQCGFNSINDFICPSGGTGTIPRGNPFPPAPPGKDRPKPTPVPTPEPPTPPSPDPVACTPGGDPYEDFKKHLMLREGYRKCVYRDSRGFPTVGVGHLVKPEDNLKVGDCISDEQVAAFLDKDARGAWEAAKKQAASAGISSSCFIIALASVNYQLGTGWTKKFPSTWNLIKNGQYCEAANALNGTLWQKQTPVRVKDFQDALRQLAADSGKPCS